MKNCDPRDLKDDPSVQVLTTDKKSRNIHVKNLSQDSTFDLFWFLFKTIFPKFDMPNLGCSLSVNEAYPPVFMVH